MLHAQEKLEATILGEILIQSDSIYAVASEMKPELFTNEKYQIICNALIALFKENLTVDLLTVTKKIMAMGQLEEVGGVITISNLTVSVATSYNLEYHFKLLQENFLRRHIVETCNEIKSRSLSNTEDVFDLIQEHNQIYSDLLNSVLTRGYQSVSEVHNELIKQHILLSGTQEFSGVPTQLKLLDNLTNGWQKSDLIIIAGRPAMGKTSISVIFAMNPAIYHNIPVAFFSLEMSSEQVVSRMQSILSQYNVSRLVKKQLKGYELQDFESRTKQLEKAPIYIDDTPSLSIFELKSKARQLVREKGVKMLVVDYLQLMQSSGGRNQSREQEIGEISRGLKAIAKELDVPVIALSQLSRGVEARGGEKKPQLSDLRESGQIEQDADMVMFCYRPEYYEMNDYEIGGQVHDTKGLFLLLVAKHRNGSLGDVPLKFIHENTTIVNHPNFMPEIETLKESSRFNDLKPNVEFSNDPHSNFWSESETEESFF
jgi:replicative DNA helicase